MHSSELLLYGCLEWVNEIHFVINWAYRHACGKGYNSVNFNTGDPLFLSNTVNNLQPAVCIRIIVAAIIDF